MTAILFAWKLAAGLVRGLADWINGLSPQVKIALACIVVLLAWTWLVNDRAYNRGHTVGLAERAAELRLCTENVSALETGIAQANEVAERAAREATERETAAANAARGRLDETERSRAREVLRGPGADQMNAFMRETFR